MSIYYKYAPDGSKIVVLSYVDDCVYWYTNEDLGKKIDTLGKQNPCEIFRICTLVYVNKNFSTERPFHLCGPSQICYLIVAKYLDTATVKVSTKFYKTTLPAEMIFTKEDVSNRDEQVDKLTKEYNIHYRACIGSLIYLLSTRVDLSFAVHKLAKFSASTG